MTNFNIVDFLYARKIGYILIFPLYRMLFDFNLIILLAAILWDSVRPPRAGPGDEAWGRPEPAWATL